MHPQHDTGGGLRLLPLGEDFVFPVGHIREGTAPTKSRGVSSLLSAVEFLSPGTRDVFARTTDHAALSFDLALTFPVAAPPWARDAFA